jgi:outer membrane autotransporter protein
LPDKSSLAKQSPVILDPIFVMERMGTLTVGGNGSHNLLEIANGAFVESYGGIIGKTSNAWNNAALVIGSGSEWNNTRDLSLGGYMAEYTTNFPAIGATELQSEWRAGGRGNSLYVGDGGLVSVGRDLHNRNYSGIAIDPGSHINIASNYYQDATSAMRFGVETNLTGEPLNALVSVGGTAEFETGAKLEYASNVGELKFDRFYTNKLVEANQLIVGGVTNANSLDLEKLAASGTLVDLLFWENDQDIYALVGRRYLADSAGFDTNSMMGRLSKEIDDLSLLGNTNANNMINILNRMSGDEQNAQLTQLYTQAAPVYMHNRAMHGAQKQVMEHTRSFRSMSRPTDSMATTNTTNVVVGASQDKHSLRGWMQGYGSWADHGESGSSTGFDQSLYGTIVGMDKTFGNLMIGAAGGYARSSLTQDNFDSSDAWTRFGILYAAFAGEKWFGDVTLSYGRSRIQTRSGTVFGAEGKSDAQHYAVYVGGGRDFHLSDGGIIFTPEAALYVDYFDQESYSDGYRDMDAYDRWSYQSRLGAALAVRKQIGSVVVKPDVHAYWLHEFNSDTDQVGYSLTGGTGRYAFGMQAPDADILEVGVGIAAALTDRLELTLSVDGQHSDRTEAVRATGRISFRF